MPKMAMSRRTLLRGALAGSGVALGLPLLEAMLNQNGTALADGTALPVRFGVWFFGNGVNPERWFPKTTGPDWHSEQLARMTVPELKPYIHVFSGLDSKTDSIQVHANVPSAVLTGTNLTRDNEDGTVSGPSIDQLVADHIGTTSRYRSLELATTKGAGASGSAFKWISHNGPDNPNAADSDPRRVFARLFGDSMAAPDPRLERIAALRKSVLDAVVQDASSLSGKLGSNDRIRLEQHLESLRALERKLDGLPVGGACLVPGKPDDISNEMVTGGGLNANMTKINQVMSSLLAAALVCDHTRVFTYMFTTPACHDAFPEADIFETFHESWHRMGTQSELINRGVSYEMDRLADALMVLRNTPDGAGNLLDNLALLATTDTQDGGNHSIETIPMLVAGSAGGAIKKPGGSIRLDGEAATRLPLTLARAVGAPLASFGVDRMETQSEITEILS